MATFSGSRATVAGLRLIVRRPVDVLIWTLVYLVVTTLPLILIAGAFAPDFMSLLQSSGIGEWRADDPALLALESRIANLQLLQMGLNLLAMTVLTSAVFRAVLEPHDRGLAFLRLGGQELWVGLGLAVIGVGAAAVFLIALLLVGVLAVIMSFGADGANDSGAALGSLILMLCVGGVIVWGWLRFSLGLPMSFATRTFRLFESWGLTRGQAAKLFGVGVCVTLMALVIQGVTLAAFFLLAGDWAADLTSALKSGGRSLGPFVPGLILIIALLSLLSVVVQVLYLAPLADIYRQLDAGEGELTTAGT